MSLSIRLKNIMKELELSGMDVVRRTGLGQATIYRILGGSCEASPQTIKILCETLNISADYLLDINTSKEGDADTKIRAKLLEEARQISACSKFITKSVAEMEEFFKD